jgi:hypothetical protein
MRIRSTRPEFYRSERVARVGWDSRYVLKALESYVDDNGVGKHDLELIVGDLFMREPSRTVARVSEAISELHEAGLLWLYEADGTDLLYIAFWEEIQRIDKPQPGRFRRPDGTLAYKESSIREPVATPREDSRTFAPVTGEQGNRGTGEQGKGIPPEADAAPPPSRALALIDAEPTAQHLVAEWIDHCEDRPPGRVIGQVAKELKSMLDEGISPERIRPALAEWNRKGLHPSTLASVVHEVANRAPAARGQQATNDLFDAAMARAIERDRSA